MTETLSCTTNAATGVVYTSNTTTLIIPGSIATTATYADYKPHQMEDSMIEDSLAFIGMVTLIVGAGFLIFNTCEWIDKVNAHMTATKPRKR